MTKHFSYLPYQGIDSFAFLGCCKDDESLAADTADILALCGVRLFCDSCGSKYSNRPESVADGIKSCDKAIIFLSEKSMSNLAFRNTVNYLHSLRKMPICIKIGNFELSHGLDIQLANAEIIPYTNAEEIADALFQSGAITQEMIGGNMVLRETNRKRNIIMAGMVVLAALIFILSAFAIIDKRTSAEYILKDADGYEYLNISKYGDDGILALAGKSIGELDLSGGQYSNIAPIKDIQIKTVNVAGIEEVSLRPLKLVEGLETVKISQDQIIYARDLLNAGLLVEVVQ